MIRAIVIAVLRGLARQLLLYMMRHRRIRQRTGDMEVATKNHMDVVRITVHDPDMTEREKDEAIVDSFIAITDSRGMPGRT